MLNFSLQLDLKTDLRDESCWDDYPEAKRFIWRRTFGVAQALEPMINEAFSP